MNSRVVDEPVRGTQIFSGSNNDGDENTSYVNGISVPSHIGEILSKASDGSFEEKEAAHKLVIKDD